MTYWKNLQLLGALPPDPYQGLCPLTPLRAYCGPQTPASFSSFFTFSQSHVCSQSSTPALVRAPATVQYTCPGESTSQSSTPALVRAPATVQYTCPGESTSHSPVPLPWWEHQPQSSGSPVMLECPCHWQRRRLVLVLGGSPGQVRQVKELLLLNQVGELCCYVFGWQSWSSEAGQGTVAAEPGRWTMLLCVWVAVLFKWGRSRNCCCWTR